MAKEQGKNRRWIEFGKDILIVLLTISALWLLVSSGLTSHLIRQENETVNTDHTQSVGWAEAVRPLRMTATMGDGEHLLRCGLQYDQQAVDELFQQTASLLVEALSNMEQPEKVTRQQWNRSLQRSPGLWFDFQGKVPLSVLLGWLSGESGELDAVVRRLLLTVERKQVVLYYYDWSTENYYRGRCDVITPEQLESAVSGLGDNGAFYAFENKSYIALDPDTLLTEDLGGRPVYSVSNPMQNGRSDLETLMEDLGFVLAGCSFYSAEEEVARSGSETVRLDGTGGVEYRAGSDQGRFLISETEDPGEECFLVVESCRRLAAQVMKDRCGQAQLYLNWIEKTHDGWEVIFDYCLDGSAVWMESGHAASFVVEGGIVSSFEMQLRNYQSGDQKDIVMPPRQASAALSALELEGQELALAYRDTGEEQMRAQWAAVRTKEE